MLDVITTVWLRLAKSCSFLCCYVYKTQDPEPAPIGSIREPFLHTYFLLVTVFSQGGRGTLMSLDLLLLMGGLRLLISPQKSKAPSAGWCGRLWMEEALQWEVKGVEKIMGTEDPAHVVHSRVLAEHTRERPDSMKVPAMWLCHNHVLGLSSPASN